MSTTVTQNIMVPGNSLPTIHGYNYTINASTVLTAATTTVHILTTNITDNKEIVITGTLATASSTSTVSSEVVPRLLMPNASLYDNMGNGTLWDTEHSESDMVLMLSVLAAVGIVLVLCLLIAAVAICRLRKLAGTEPQLLTFSNQSASRSKPRDNGVHGFVNKAYQETMPSSGVITSHVTTDACMSSFTSWQPPETSDTESSNAAEGQDDLLQTTLTQCHLPAKRAAPKVLPRRNVPKPVPEHADVCHVTSTSGSVLPVWKHTENGISECVNPLFNTDKNNKPFVSLPLESITEGEDDDNENDEVIENLDTEPEATNQQQEPEQVIEGQDLGRVTKTTFDDLDDTEIRPELGLNMADAVSGTQSCPNTPLMFPTGSAPCGQRLKQQARGGKQSNWASESRLPDDVMEPVLDDVCVGGLGDVEQCVEEAPAAPSTEDLHGSWMGQLDHTWEAQTTF